MKGRDSMLCKEVIAYIERDFPESYALEWDNVGLLAGRDDKEVKRIFVALDATDEVIEAAIEKRADMLVTHHPLIFGSLKRVNNQDFIGRRLLRLIRNDISYYAMHTNYDVMGMAGLSGNKMRMEHPDILEITCDSEKAEGIGRVADFPDGMTLKECCDYVKDIFHLESVKVFGNLKQKVHRIAISPGAGGSMIAPALKQKADVLVTGDIDHHKGIDAVAQGLNIIDAGHYGIEHIFIEDMGQYLRKNLSEIEIMAAPIVQPYLII